MYVLITNIEIIFWSSKRLARPKRPWCSGARYKNTPVGRGLTLARILCFATFAGAGGVRPPWCFQTKRRRASRERPADFSRRLLAIGGIIFGPRSIFEPVMAGQMSNFRKFQDFCQIHKSISAKLSSYGSTMKPSSFNSAQNEVFRCISVEYLGR